MNDWHPQDIELARFSEFPDDEWEKDGLGIGMRRERIAAHLRWCTRCRSLAAEYDWLRQAMVVSLRDVADSAPTPTPKWHHVRGGVLAQERRWGLGVRLSAAFGAALLVCQLLVAVPIWHGAQPNGMVAQRTNPPRVSVATAPRVGMGLAPAVAGATPTPVTSDVGERLPTPAPMLLPTPPESEL